MRVLAVDDDVVARMAIHGMVTALGHECLVSPGGLDAWRTLQIEPFDVVITDRVMPDLDGLQLCQKIRDITSESGYVYIIVASAMGEDDDAKVGMLAGADDYLCKPLRLRTLELKLIAAERVTAIHRHLDRLNEHLLRTAVHEAHLNEELSKANQLQSDLIAMLSHDARQPLTAVIGFIETTLDVWETTTDDVKRAHVGKALSAAGRLDRLIEDVLTMASLDSGTIACRSEPVIVADAVREVLVAGNDQPPIELTGDLTARASIDPWHLRQIMANLIGNATKYGAAPITVAVQSCDQGVQIRVRDHGEGVPPEFIPHLFDRFSRAASGIATRQRGTGLGLYIVKKLIEANTGSIDYSPAPGGTGACFTVRLPQP